MDESRSIPLRPDPLTNRSEAPLPGDTIDKDQAPSAELAAEAPPVRVTRNTGAVPTGLTPAENREFPVLPGYDVLGILGHGGMGIVFKARQLKANRLVALKMIRAVEHASSHDRLRFQIETEAVARLQHPNIVQLYEVGEIAGQPFFSLEFCPGGTLELQLKEQQPAPREAAELVETMARAMHYAHLRGVVHRDLKPANVLFVGEPPGADATGIARRVPKINDFGLAKRLDDEGRAVSLSGTIMGTPAYMAPEQAAGKVRDTGPSADVYALGAILYECLSGRPPFHGATTLETLRQVLHDEPVPLSRLVKKLPHDLATICHKCLAKEPSRRYADAAALADDLRRFRDGEPIQARPIGLFERMVRWARRRPAAAAALAATMLALVVSAALIASSSANRSLQAARQAEEQQRRKAEEQQRLAEEALSREETSRYYLRIVLAEREWSEGNIVRTEELLDACPEALRGWEWHYLKKQCHAELWTVRGERQIGETWSASTLSRDGRRAAWVVGDNRIEVWDTATGQVLVTLAGYPGQGPHANGLTFSPDGRYLASTFGVILVPGEVKVWDVETGQEVLSFPGLSGWGAPIAFSPDSRRLAVGGGERIQPGKTWLWDLESGEELQRFANPDDPKPLPVLGVSFSPDGTRLATAGGEGEVDNVGRQRRGEVTIWDTASGEARLRFREHPEAATAVAFRPDGRQIASGDRDGTIHLWDPDTGRVSLTLRNQGTSVLVYQPGGARLASAGTDQMVRVSDTATGQELAIFRGHASEIQAAVFDGKNRLLSLEANQVLKAWDFAVRPGARTFRDHVARGHDVAFSPDGRQLACCSVEGGVVTIRDTASGKVLASHQVGKEPTGNVVHPAWAVAFSPDGKQLAVGLGDWKKADLPVPVKVVTVGDERAEPIVLEGHFGLARGVAFGPGRLLASTGGELNRPGRLMLHDLAGGPKRTLEVAEGGLKDVAFSPGGRLVAATAPNNQFVRVWEVATGKEQYTLRTDESCFGVAFSPDGAYLASSDGASVRIWDVRGQPRALLRGHAGWLLRVVFSPDGRRIASAGSDRTIKIWDWPSGQEIVTLRGHSDIIWALAFSPDGKRLASGDQDGFVKIWDADRGPEPDVRRLRR